MKHGSTMCAADMLKWQLLQSQRDQPTVERRMSSQLDSLPLVPSQKHVVPPDPTPTQFGCGDMGHAASLIARGRRKKDGNLKSTRHDLMTKHLSMPAIRTPQAQFLGSSVNGLLFRATVYPQTQRKVGISEEVAARTLTVCIRGLKRVNSPVTTESISQRLLADGWLADEVQDVLASGRRQLNGMTRNTRAAVEPRASVVKNLFGFKTEIVVPSLPYQAPPMTQAELPAYLKKQVSMLPVTIVNSSSGCTALHESLNDPGCTVLMRFGDIAAAQAATTHLHGKIKSVDEFCGYRAIREGAFVKLIVDDYRRQEDMDKLTLTLREVHLLRIPRRKALI